MAWTQLETNNDNWVDKTFTADTTTPTNNLLYDIATSDVISNNSGAENMDVIINFSSILPGASVNGVNPSYKLFIVVEEEVVPDVWNTIAESFGQRYQILPGGPSEAKFIIQTKNTTDQGQPFSTLNGFKWYVNENPSEKLRVRVFFEEGSPGGTAALQSITISGAYRLY